MTSELDSILEEAAQIVRGARQADYGTPRENHQRTADLWNAYLGPGVHITARMVCVLNILQKLSRDRFKAKRDNLVDVAGYAENAHLCEPPADKRTPAERQAAIDDFVDWVTKSGIPLKPAEPGPYRYEPKTTLPPISVPDPKLADLMKPGWPSSVKKPEWNAEDGS